MSVAISEGMIKITRLLENDAIARLRVEGRLGKDAVGELRAACEAVLASNHLLLLDLAGVTFADQVAIETLRAIVRRGASVVATSGYLRAALRKDAGPDPQRNGETTEEQDLVDRLRSGDAAAFEMLVRRFGARMLAVGRRFFPNDQDAQDVVQDACLSAFKAIGAFEGTARLSTWLHRIVVNAALMKLRSRRRRPEESIDDLLPRFEEDGHLITSESPWDGAADRVLDRRETRVMVRRAIERLPESFRQVLLLRDIEELDTDEVAAMLGTTTNAVKSRLHRARQALRTLIEREMGDLRSSPVVAKAS